ncbi:MAG: 4'-phosphopantetheinyl transferase superfamily protein [Acidiferrobacterales bacterium]|nr:4'-phosphopantetheinyl transferase superfamily protein [Acidiferrobacterales bacterium]
MKEQYGKKLLWQQIVEGQHPTIDESEIHLWWLPLTLDSAQQETALTLLSDIQRDRYQRRKTPERKLSYLAGRYYLLKLLSQYTAVPANEILLSYSRLNKPYLTSQHHNIEFNFTDTNIQIENEDGLTTSRSYGLYAFCKNFAIGVDIESLDRSANFAAISDDRFSDSEQKFVTEKNGEVNKQRCLAIWTRKEAFGKALGMGINFKMNALDLSSSDSFQLDFSSHDKDWRQTQIELPYRVISCVTHQGHQDLEIKAFNCVNHLP